jgi:hypothetical protein
MQSDIVMMDGFVVCYKMQTDVWFYAVCGTEENEVMVASVVNGYYDALTILLQYVSVSPFSPFLSLPFFLISLFQTCTRVGLMS